MNVNELAVDATVDACMALYEVIKAHPNGVPAGEIYIRLQGKISYVHFMLMLSVLQEANKITYDHHWVTAI